MLEPQKKKKIKEGDKMNNFTLVWKGNFYIPYAE